MKKPCRMHKSFNIECDHCIEANILLYELPTKEVRTFLGGKPPISNNATK